MLIDIDPKFEDPVTGAICGAIAGNKSRVDFVRLQRGVYQIGHFNFNYMLPGYPNDWEDFPDMPGPKDEYDDGPNEYGVCDSPTQFMEALGDFLEADPGQFVVSLTLIRKKDDDPVGGWRWHKWGPYIGKQKRDGCEYLAQESTIEEIYCYHVYKKKP